MAKRRRKGRPVSGILLLDKPVGITSNAALQKVKWIYKAAKAGHTGSLDPLAEGLLPICLGEATKISAYLLDADKRYTTTVKLGEKTTTADAEGEVIESRPVENISAQRVTEVLQNYLGEQEQIPPMYSAVKHEGKRLYDLAREGKEVERKSRKITIYSLELTSINADELVLDVHCSKGTYIRTLAEDIGEMLGCGGHVSALRRTSVGPFDESNCMTLASLEEQADAPFAELDALLLPIDNGLNHWPEVRLDANSSHYLKQGQPVLVPKAPTEGWVRVYDASDNFIGVGEVDDDGLIAPRRLMIAS
ncbi:tRNA pseudouridine(55) synthase TruB [Solemya velum gill symbiont]|uniref:tRNA pseudouridine(55) synthase TruB n=1 Tax=Solemya velum gill symbiont TaxID=2340 RepID=UPI000997729F|nr:tRNA pseudouridine(55) synthase TruB [Solemya velum gill symbiont]OOZ45706.1 tRNA pseudouridine(55) synthase TruB [Solemya velum gill symbiont]OOZ46964.1 tRNA pseudouridine(55) synthase TruB [Solemya velum gill symbiont]OOZ48754.1 tRNA pseudouridine(55) synthase TruB [Solemya velum gill symbiont]OOZ52063.1 tRNA pseudouridine(55) synthase TruB [Solemya velum gill symbiont]OOZ54754.1 tRNA pseudouridine(55) synthase TruB [Solemya velum gill symbiont]